MSYLFTEEEYKGYAITVEQDEQPESPNDWGNTDLFLTANHNQFYVKVRGYNPGEFNLEDVSEEYHVFPLIAYIHSGVSLSMSRDHYPFNCPWDAGQVGYVFASKESWKEEKEAGEAALSLLETWNDYLSGNVWGFVVEDEDGLPLDSCWGFYGDPDYCLNEAKASVDAMEG